MIDVHCHLLPGLDDGPATPDDAVALARAAVAAGTTTVVATPHVSARHPQNSAARIAVAATALRARLEEEGVSLRVLTGAEVAVLRADDLADEELESLRLGGGPWLLAECPYTATSDEFEFRLRALAARGHRLLLAHPERIAAFRQDHRLLRQLVDLGMRCQLTASSLAGRFGRSVQHYSWTLVDEGLVHVVASDAHAATHRRPDLGPRLEAEGVPADWIAYWTVTSPAALLAGEPPPAPPAGAPRPIAPRWRSWLKAAAPGTPR